MSTRAAVFMGFALVVGLSLSGCKGKGEDRPTEKQGKDIITNQIKTGDRAEAIKLITFRKTNGIFQEGFGINCYSMEFECEIEFTRDCKWMYHDQGRFESRTPEVVDFSPYQVGKNGQRTKVTGRIDFEKTDNGWRALIQHATGRKVAGATSALDGDNK